MPTGFTPDLIGYFLVFARVGAILMLLPAFGEEQTPIRIRLMLALLLAAVIYPTLLVSLPPMPKSDAALAAALGREILIGLMIGGVVRLFMQALHVAGTAIAMQTGFAAAMQFDPSMGGQATVVTRFITLLGVVLIFASGLHHVFIAGIARSYAIFSASTPIAPADFAKLMVDATAQSFLLGVQLAAPFLAFSVVFNIGLGLVARVAPQIQVFFITQPLSLLIGLALLLASLGVMMNVFIENYASAIAPWMGTRDGR